ncbi:MAG: carbohydrate binding domain-containing protein [Bacteroidota bacterium]
MKLIQTLSRLIPKLFISLSILCWIPSGSWGQNNLIQNGDVEIGNGSTPDYWTTGAWRLPYAQFTWDQTDAYSGSKSLHISVNAAQPTDAFWYQNVTGRIEPGKVYNVRAWVKGENITAQGSYGATVGLESGIPPYSTSLGAALGTASLGSFGWQQYEGTVRVKPTGSNPIVLAARLGGNANLASGNVWFDDIHIDDDFTHIAAKKHIYFDFETNDIAARITPQNLSLWQDRLDSVYDALEDLTGLSNQNGDSLGIYTTRQDLGNAEALAGNPIPWVRRYFLPKLSDVNNRGSWSWTMFHEISHRFDHPT